MIIHRAARTYPEASLTVKEGSGKSGRLIDRFVVKFAPTAVVHTNYDNRVHLIIYHPQIPLVVVLKSVGAHVVLTIRGSRNER